MPAITESAASAAPPHHCADGGFCNSDGVAISKPFRDLMKWRREAPTVEIVTFPLAANNPSALAANRSEATLTWIGHATWLWQLDGVNILTDPHFSERASPLPFAGPKRGTPPGLPLSALPPIEIVLLTHNHYDHLDQSSVAALAARYNPHFIVPLKLGGTVAAMGAKRVSELDWGDTIEVNGIEIIAEPCYHWSARGMFDRNETLWVSYVLRGGGLRLLFIGDTGYSADFAALGDKYSGFDLAAIPIGAYEPRWFMKQAHINPDEAVKIFQDLRTRHAVANHWGVFVLTNEPMREPPQRLQQALTRAALDDGRFAVYQHGETRSLEFLKQAA